MKQSPQTRKLNEAMRAALAEVLLYQVSDPRLAFVSVTGVEVSKDRSLAKIYVSAEKAQYDDVMAGLDSAKGRIRSLVGSALSWRVTPELRFYLDPTLDEAERISQALRDTPQSLQIPKNEEGYPL